MLCETWSPELLLLVRGKTHFKYKILSWLTSMAFIDRWHHLNPGHLFCPNYALYIHRPNLVQFNLDLSRTEPAKDAGLPNPNYAQIPELVWTSWPHLSHRTDHSAEKTDPIPHLDPTVGVPQTTLRARWTRLYATQHDAWEHLLGYSWLLQTLLTGTVLLTGYELDRVVHPASLTE